VLAATILGSGMTFLDGTAVNVALPPGTRDGGWLRAFDAVVPGVVRAFKPDVLVTQCGCDTHHEDPLANLELTVDVERLVVSAPALGIDAPFPLDPATQERFLQGLDDIGITLRSADHIDRFESARPGYKPSVAAR